MLRQVMEDAGYARTIDMSSTRAGYIPGTHEVGFDGPAETVTLTHTVRDRCRVRPRRARGRQVAERPPGLVHDA